jgi:hypothetical protein
MAYYVPKTINAAKGGIIVLVTPASSVSLEKV